MQSEIHLSHQCPACKTTLDVPAMGDFDCSNCGAQYRQADGIPCFLDTDVDSSVRSAYESKADDQVDESVKAGYKFPVQQKIMQNAFSEVVGPLRGDELLMDVGCGTGSISKPLAEQVTVVGVDLARGVLKYARQNGLHPYHADALSLPFEGGQFDCIISPEVLQLIDDTEQFFREMHRLLKNDGRLLVSTLNQKSLLRRMYRLVMRPDIKKSIHAPNQHDIESLVGIANSCGFSLEKVIWTHSPLMFLRQSSKIENPFGIFAANYLLELRKPA